MSYDDGLMILPEQLTPAPPIGRLDGKVLSIGRRVMQKEANSLKLASPKKYRYSLFYGRWSSRAVYSAGLAIGRPAEARSAQLAAPLHGSY